MPLHKKSITCTLTLQVFETSSHSKMRYSPKFLFLLFFSIYQCKAAPPGEVPTKTRSRGINFTDEEDEFIIKELSRLLVENEQFSSKYLWGKLAEKHCEMWTRKTHGFPQERTGESLLRHFRKKLMTFSDAELNKKLKVPESLLERFRQDLNEPPPVHIRQLYSKEEEELIIEELLKPTCTNFFAPSTWEGIREKLDMKRHAPGFVCERTAEALLAHARRLKADDQLPGSVKQKFWKNEKGTRALYTQEEDKFIIEEFLKPTCTNIFSSSTLNEISAKHGLKCQTRTRGFEHERTTQSLRSHIRRLKRSGELPEEVTKKTRKYEKVVSGASSSNPTPLNQQTLFEDMDEEDEDE